MQSLQKKELTNYFLEISLETLDQLEVEAIVIGICTDLKPSLGIMSFLDWRLCGFITELIKKENITGKINESILISTFGRIKSPCVFLFGFGEKKLLETSYQSSLQNILTMLKKVHVKNFALSLPSGFKSAAKIAQLLLQKPLPVQLAGIFDPNTK